MIKKTMHKRYMIFSLLLGFLWVPIESAEAGPFSGDTIQREMVLEREYQPVNHKAEKAFFNPLVTTTAKALKPIQFAKNSYPIAMSLTPKLFDPIDNPQAMSAIEQKFHARLLGGYPTLGGANIGFMTQVGERGALHLSLDHLTRYIQGTNDEVALSSLDQTHDTDLSISYQHALSDRTLRADLELFHHGNTFYSLFSPVALRPGEVKLDAYYPLYQMAGTQVHFSLSPAPISMASRWQYDLDALVSYTSKDDISTLYDSNPVVQLHKEGLVNKNKVSELTFDLGGAITYQFAGSDWGFGSSAKYQFISISAIHTLLGTPAPLQQLSVAPYLSYTSPRIVLRAGAALQLLNKGDNRLLVVPDVALRYRAHDLFSVYMLADGGAKFDRLRELYGENRWLSAQSVYTGFDIAKYRLLLGFEVGSINGFSLDIQGGYTRYSQFSDWRYELINTELTSPEKTRQLHLFTPLFVKADRGGVNQFFVNAEARYLSPIGLDLAAKVQFNKYSSATGEELQTVGHGLPTANLNLSAGYQVMDRLFLYLNFEALMGIKYFVPLRHVPSLRVLPSDVQDYFNYYDLSARVSYDLNEHVGLSLIGQNLLHQKQGRWLGYNRPGATGMLAVTLKF